LDGLPDEAIKVVEHNSTGFSRILNKCSSYLALHRLGIETFNKKVIYVEDPLAKLVVEQALQALDDAEKNAFKIKVAPGGAQDMKVRQIPSHIVSGHDCFFIFDGDQKRVEQFTDPSELSGYQLDSLSDLLKDELGEIPEFSLSGGNDKAGTRLEKIECQKRYLQWASIRVKYLNFLCPEAFILNFFEETKDNVYSSKIAKKMFREIYSHGMTSEQESGAALLMLRKIPDDNPEMVFIRELAKSWL
jgi:hypothetical protein